MDLGALLAIIGLAAGALSVVLVIFGLKPLSDEFDREAVAGLNSATAVVALAVAALSFADISDWKLTLWMLALFVLIAFILLAQGIWIAAMWRRRRSRTGLDLAEERS